MIQTMIQVHSFDGKLYYSVNGSEMVEADADTIRKVLGL